MTGAQQRAALHRQIWQIANDVRGAVDGWDFKQYVLGALFYRFISENFALYIEAGDESIRYADLDDSVITPEIKNDAIKTKGYFVYPSQLFANVAATAHTNDNLNTDLAAIFSAKPPPMDTHRKVTSRGCSQTSIRPATDSVTPSKPRAHAWQPYSKE
jgi:type I restriction enzyme M protein